MTYVVNLRKKFFHFVDMTFYLSSVALLLSDNSFNFYSNMLRFTLTNIKTILESNLFSNTWFQRSAQHDK